VQASVCASTQSTMPRSALIHHADVGHGPGPRRSPADARPGIQAEHHFKPGMCRSAPPAAAHRPDRQRARRSAPASSQNLMVGQLLPEQLCPSVGLARRRRKAVSCCQDRAGGRPRTITKFSPSYAFFLMHRHLDKLFGNSLACPDSMCALDMSSHA